MVERPRRGGSSAEDQAAVSGGVQREAIELVRLTGKSIRQVAKDLGISEVSLRNWVKQAAAEAGERPGGLSSDEREELQRLRRENQTLRMEREILKKAAAFFAKETDER